MRVEWRKGRKGNNATQNKLEQVLEEQETEKEADQGIWGWKEHIEQINYRSQKVSLIWEDQR